MLPNEEMNKFNFNSFYEIYYRRAFLFANSYVHDKWVAEDIVSDALVVLWENIQKYKINHPLTFLFSIVKNKSIDYLRQELIRQEALAQMSAIGLRELNTRIATLKVCEPEENYSEEVTAIIEATLDSLPERTRDVFSMSRFQNLTKSEIAIVLGMTAKGVEYHISKALKRMRVTLKDYLPAFGLFYFFL